MVEPGDLIHVDTGSTRVIRNVTDELIHVSSLHRLTPEQYVDAIRIASGITELLDPSALYQAYTEPSHVGHMINGKWTPFTPMEDAMPKIVSAHLVANWPDIGGDHPIARLLYTASHQAGFYAQEAARIAVDKRGKFIDGIDFTARHSSKEFKGMKVVGDCGAPGIGRSWVRAGAEAIDIFASKQTP